MMECCICHKEILDRIPPLCDDDDCEERFIVEVEFNQWAKKQVELNPDFSKMVDKHFGELI